MKVYPLNFTSLKNAIVPKKSFIFLKDEDGNAHYTQMYKGDRFERSLQENGHTIGSGWSHISDAKIVGDAYPDYYKGKKYLWVNNLSSDKSLYGIGTELMKEFVRASFKLGCGGRIALNASTIKGEMGTPIPFYYKIGLRSVDSEINENIEDHILNKAPLIKTSTTMFLPKENIEALLSRKVN